VFLNLQANKMHRKHPKRELVGCDWEEKDPPARAGNLFAGRKGQAFLSTILS
jgi:hypothetical protein